MGQLIYPILRGALIHPAANEGIDYYLCLITLPTLADGAQPEITPDYPTETDDSGILKYNYSGNIPTGYTGPVSDYLLPVYANQKVTNVNSVQVTGSDGNYVRGNPNNRIPPVTPISLIKNSNYEPANTVFKGLYGTNNYFVLMMVSTGASDSHPTGGYTNTFKSFQANGTTLQGVLNPDSSITTGRAVVGAVPATYQQYDYSQAIDGDGNECTSLLIKWDSPLLL